MTKVTSFMECVMDGTATWSDPPEKHEGWPTGVGLITAATLAKIDRLHPSINGAWETWAEVLIKTFDSGTYSNADERRAHQVLNGITTRNKYPKLAAIYPLLLLSATGNKLPKELETSYLDLTIGHHSMERKLSIYCGSAETGKGFGIFPQVSQVSVALKSVVSKYQSPGATQSIEKLIALYGSSAS